MSADPSDLAYWSTTIRNHRPPATDVGWTPIRPDDWKDGAACRGLPIDNFYLGIRVERAPKPVRKVCGGCPVQADCLEWAFATGDAHAVLGGLTPYERDRIRSRKAIA